MSSGVTPTSKKFQSTLSMRRATQTIDDYGAFVEFQSTLSMRRATSAQPGARTEKLFQSTLSMRRATTCVAAQHHRLTLFQSTLSMRRATRSSFRKNIKKEISIHALHEESDSTLAGMST